MAQSRDPLAAFDGDTVETVAAATDVASRRLRDLARNHQENVRDIPGVDDIVYEWRNQFHQDPLVHRTESVYVLALRDHVWTEFAEALDATDDELAALRRLHDEQGRALAADTTRLDADDAVVLTRP